MDAGRPHRHSTEAVNRNEKLPIYAAAGVEHAWLIDPVAQTLEVHTDLVEGKWRQVRVYHAHESVRAQPFEAIEIELAALWSPPKRNP